MSYSFTKEQTEMMDALGCKVRWASRAETHRDNVVEGGKPVVDKTKPTGMYCEVFDAMVGGEPYAMAFGTSKEDAFVNAMKQAITAEKPMTPAQRYAAAQVKEVVGAKDTRIAELEAKLKALEASQVPATNSEPVAGRKPAIK